MRGVGAHMLYWWVAPAPRRRRASDHGGASTRFRAPAPELLRKAASVKAVIYHRYDDVRVEDVPIPEIGPDEVLLRPSGCGLCGSDIAKIVGQVAPPVILGHELAGRLAAVGAAGDNISAWRARGGGAPCPLRRLPVLPAWASLDVRRVQSK